MLRISRRCWNGFSYEGIPAFAADNLAGKGIALLILSISLLDAFLACPLLNQGCCSFKILMADNCFMVIWHIVLIEVTVILVTIKIAVGIGLLENAVTGVFFIPDDVANTGRGPATALLGRNLFLVQLLGNGSVPFPERSSRKMRFTISAAQDLPGFLHPSSGSRKAHSQAYSFHPGSVS